MALRLVSACCLVASHVSCALCFSLRRLWLVTSLMAYCFFVACEYEGRETKGEIYERIIKRIRKATESAEESVDRTVNSEERLSTLERRSDTSDAEMRPRGFVDATPDFCAFDPGVRGGAALVDGVLPGFARTSLSASRSRCQGSRNTHTHTHTHTTLMREKSKARSILQRLDATLTLSCAISTSCSACAWALRSFILTSSAVAIRLDLSDSTTRTCKRSASSRAAFAFFVSDCSVCSSKFIFF